MSRIRRGLSPAPRGGQAIPPRATMLVLKLERPWREEDSGPASAAAPGPAASTGLAGPAACLGICEHVVGVVCPQFCAGLWGGSQDVPGRVASRWTLAGGHGLGGVSVCLGAGRGSLRGVGRPGNPVRPLGRWGAGQDGY